MSTSILTPQDQTAAVELSGGRWRKQILPYREINYTDRTGTRKLKFDRRYLAELVDSFKRGAFPQVPFQLANAANQHTNDPERFRGELCDLELTSDGLFGVFDINEDGAKVLSNNPKLGVSARILEGFERSDGQRFSRAMQHVLGTLDPKVHDQKPWEKVELSNSDAVSETVDLSGQTYEEETVPKTKVGTATEDIPAGGTGTITLELSNEEAERLRELLADQAAVAEFSHELEEAIDGPDGPEDEGTRVTEGPEVRELSNAVLDAQSARIIQLSNDLRSAAVEKTVTDLANAGIVPALIDKFKPFIGLAEGEGAVELSNGETVDFGTAAKELVDTVIGLARDGHAIIDYDVEIGLASAQDPVQAQREKLLDQMDEELGR